MLPPDLKTVINSPRFDVRFINIDENFLADRWPSSFTNICFYCCYTFPLKEVNRLGTIQESREVVHRVIRFLRTRTK